MGTNFNEKQILICKSVSSTMHVYFQMKYFSDLKKSALFFRLIVNILGIPKLNNTMLKRNI